MEIENEQPGDGPPYEFVGVPTAVPTTYADNCIFGTSFGSTVRLQFVEYIPGAADSTMPGLKVRYVRNIVMPTEGFMHMMQYLATVRDKIVAAEAEPQANAE